jgi:hypothetical protein
MPAGVRTAGTTSAGLAAALPGEDDGAEPSATYALGGPLPGNGASTDPSPPTPLFPNSLHPADIELLAQVDEAHESLSGPATRRILEREFRDYGKPEFERLAAILNGHLYNLRRTRAIISDSRTTRRRCPAR